MDPLKEHYTQLFRKHGTSVESLQWSSRATQEARFQILAEIIKNNGSVIDLGAGLGDLYTYLRSNGFSGKYLGLDFIPEFIHFATEKYKLDVNAKFQVFDINADKLSKEYDYILVSGMFNNEMKDNWSFLVTTVEKMFDACKVGIAFNCLSTYVDYKDSGLYYCNPLEIFDFCKRNLSRKVNLRHEYLVKQGSVPFEFTMYVLK